MLCSQLQYLEGRNSYGLLLPESACQSLLSNGNAPAGILSGCSKGASGSWVSESSWPPAPEAPAITLKWPSS